MSKLFFYLYIALFATNAAAQAVPEALKQLFEENRSQEPVKVVKSLTPGQRDFLLAGMQPVPDGYLKVLQTKSNVHLIDGFLSNASLGPKAPPVRQFALSPNDRLPGGVAFVGAIVESPNRVDYLLREEGGGAIMLTMWDLRKSQARIVVPEESFNRMVAGHRAILSLAVAPAVNDCLWKIIWWDDAVSFEFYVTDKLTKDRPERKPEEIARMAEAVLSSADKTRK
jgi:hypothetical protein